MKYIRKGSPPRELQDWFEGQPVEDGRRINCGYDDMPTNVKDAVKERLLHEQGGLCCYTGLRIASENSHVEHFKPQRLCADHEDVAYTNLLAAHPGASAGGCPFGAPAKDDWYDSHLLVSPLHQRCETQFRFDQFGAVNSSDGQDSAALETIERLRLNHPSLSEIRQRTIDEALFPDNRRLSKAQLQRLIEGLYSRDTNGRFPALCFVIKDVAQDLLRRAERERKRKQAIRSQARS
jgi:uncharacterized protein (TIGR02646 family)